MCSPVALSGVTPPLFFVSVASKGFSVPVNPLKSTLMDILVSVADKRLRETVGMKKGAELLA